MPFDELSNSSSDALEGVRNTPVIPDIPPITPEDVKGRKGATADPNPLITVRVGQSQDYERESPAAESSVGSSIAGSPAAPIAASSMEEAPAAPIAALPTMESPAAELPLIEPPAGLSAAESPAAGSPAAGSPAVGSPAVTVPDIAVGQTPESDFFAPNEGDGLIALKNLEERRKRKRRNRIIKIVVVVAIVAIALALFFLRGMLFQPPEEEYVPETYTVTKEDFDTVVQGSGTLKAGSSVVVTPEVAGIIDEVHVVEGQHVERGDVLVVLRNSDLDKAISEAEDGIEAANKAVAAAQRDVDDAQRDLTEARNQYKKAAQQASNDESRAAAAGDEAYDATYEAAIDAIPDDATKAEKRTLKAEAKEAAQEAYQRAYDAVSITEVEPFDESSYNSAIEAAARAVTDAQDDVTSAQKAYDQAVEDSEKRIVKAPAAGTVLALNAVEGAAVGGAEGGTSESNGELMQIANLSRMRVSIEVNEIDISTVEEGQRATVTFPAIQDLELRAKVVDISSVATGSSEIEDLSGGVVTFAVSLEITKPDSRLKPGMTASVDIKTQDLKNVLVVPVSAVMEGDTNDIGYVEVVTNPDTLETESREVTIQARSASEVVIESGLREGEEILLGGMMGEDDMMDEEAFLEG